MKNQNKECNGALYTNDGKVFLKLLNNEYSYYTVETGTECIAENAFAGLSYSNKIDYLDLPESVMELRKGAFQRMALTSIAIPPKVTEIPEKLLFGCINLEHIYLPEGVESIYQESFWKCSKLTHITLPYNLQKIEGNPFAYSGIRQMDCYSPFFTVQDDCLYTTDGTLIFCFSDKYEFNIPSWVKEIGESAFEGNRYIKRVSFPGLIKIAPRAFANCSSLTAISVPMKMKHRFKVEKTLYKLIKERNNNE
jgi:hypothetical protein